MRISIALVASLLVTACHPGFTTTAIRGQKQTKGADDAFTLCRAEALSDKNYRYDHKLQVCMAQYGWNTRRAQ